MEQNGVQNMVPAMVESAHMMLEKWKPKEGKEIEMYEEFKLYTSEVISRTAFGSSYIEETIIFEMLSNMFLLASRDRFRMKLPGISKIWKTADEIEAEKLDEGVRRAVLEIAKKREKKVMAGEAYDYGDDLLGQLRKAYHDEDENKKITLDDLVDECKTFYVAAQETTTSMLTWVMFLLAVHSNWQEEARKEVLDVFGSEDPNSDGIAKSKMV